MTHTAKAYFKRGHGADPVVLSTADEIDHLVDALVAEPWENSVAALYVDGRLNEAGVPDHELLVAVDFDNKSMGALRYMGGGGTYFSQGSSSEDGSVLYYYMGSDREFPRDAVLPIEEVRAAVKAFLAGGGARPESVEWRAWATSTN